MHNLVIRGGTLYDGTGRAGQTGDLAIDGERITQVGGRAGPGAREIDASGLAVAPGFIQTAMTDKLSDEAREGLLTLIPAAKMGRPEDVAAVVAFLAGPDSSYITGEVIRVDGGMAM